LWLQVRCIGTGIHALASVAPTSNLKNQAALLVLALDSPTLMSKVLRCDLEGVKHVLSALDPEGR